MNDVCARAPAPRLVKHQIDCGILGRSRPRLQIGAIRRSIRVADELRQLGVGEQGSVRIAQRVECIGETISIEMSKFGNAGIDQKAFESEGAFADQVAQYGSVSGNSA